MRRPALPLPPLIQALRATSAAEPGGQSYAATLGERLGNLAEAVGLSGIRLQLADIDPMQPGSVGWGSLAEAPSRPADFELHAEGGVPVGQLWTDGEQGGGDEAAVAVEAAVQAARAHLFADRAREHLAALDAALHGISGALAVDTVLQLIVDRVRNLAGAQYAALGIVGEEGGIQQFHTSGLDPADRERIGDLPRGHGLLGLLIREGRSIRIRDIETDPRRYGFPPHHPEMHSFLGVPVAVRGRSVGNLYLTNKRDDAPFSAADQELVERFALHAGIAIENARLAKQVQQLVLIEERERIGADLHDGVIQRIYGVNLSLDEVPELVATRPDEAAARVEQAIEALNATIAEIREFIYILR
ncbi:MAG TPA: GAF domain-containing protein, partial [Candidatus Limnocylindrales bacterium]|nr:GAF domain-containing protein [Candidatus Limnocylindrales bacterium]